MCIRRGLINGGIINTRGTNAYLGSGDYLIAEADESDGTFIRIPAAIAVITNIDAEHLDYYKSFDKLKEAYESFIHNLPFYGFAVVCKDHDEVANLIKKIQDREIITYGIEAEQLDIQAFNIEERIDGTNFDVRISERIHGQESFLRNIHLPMAGSHNVLNSLAAISIAVKLKLSSKVIEEAFHNFTGVKRRFTKTGEVNGVVIVDDYAHHPAEIKATLLTAKQVTKLNYNSKVIAVVQPHRYTRVESLFSEFVHCFDNADVIYISEIYSAGETPIEGINKEVLISSLRQNYKNKSIFSFDSLESFVDSLEEQANPGDLILFMGAGTSTKWAYELPELLNRNLKNN